MTNSFSDLGEPIKVPFDKIYIDPNNPRISPDPGSRYEDPDEIFDDEFQKELTTLTYDIYNAGELEDAIVAQGWVPIDSILVWEHPDRPKHYIVVEGNTRTSLLRNIRGPRIQLERAKLKKLKKGGKTPPEEIKHQERSVAQLEEIIKDTDKLRVFPVIAATIEELEEKLPRLLGVRHISHARQWGPYATNLYITSLYQRMFRERHGPDEPLRLEQDLIGRVAAMVSLGETKTRRNIQAASAFEHFKRHHEDKLPEGEKLLDEDHYFFELILQNKYPQEQFGFSKDRLYLPDESEQALFEWAFSKPRTRGKEDENQNIFYKAENIRLWNDMSKYDVANGTGFATLFDVDAPEQATKSMRLVEAEYLHHKALQKPLDTLQALLEALKKLEGETIVTQAEFLKPTLQEIAGLTEHYLRWIEDDDAE